MAFKIGKLDPDMRDYHGNTCLHVAAQNNNKRISKLLLRNGADINAANRQGYTPTSYAFKYGYSQLGLYLQSKGGRIK